MTEFNIENLESQGTEVLIILFEGDSPGSAGWIGIYEYHKKFYILTDFEENYGPFLSLNQAMGNELFDHLNVDFELSSDTLSTNDLSEMKLELQHKSARNING
tara:strand:+ start:1037 stop:1345 length:309 start_codon:yes stop_codon:yes gene_type:complete